MQHAQFYIRIVHIYIFFVLFLNVLLEYTGEFYVTFLRLLLELNFYSRYTFTTEFSLQGRIIPIRIRDSMSRQLSDVEEVRFVIPVQNFSNYSACLVIQIAAFESSSTLGESVHKRFTYIQTNFEPQSWIWHDRFFVSAVQNPFRKNRALSKGIIWLNERSQLIARNISFFQQPQGHVSLNGLRRVIKLLSVLEKRDKMGESNPSQKFNATIWQNDE